MSVVLCHRLRRWHYNLYAMAGKQGQIMDPLQCILLVVCLVVVVATVGHFAIVVLDGINRRLGK